MPEERLKISRRIGSTRTLANPSAMNYFGEIGKMPVSGPKPRASNEKRAVYPVSLPHENAMPDRGFDREPDRQLVARVLGHRAQPEDDAVRQFVELCGRCAATVAQRTNADRDELQQTLMLHLLKDDCRNLRLWNGEASLRTWLFTVLARLAISGHRQRKRQPLLLATLPEVATQGEDSLALLESREETAFRASQVLAAAKQLSATEKTVLLARYVEGKSPAQLAAELGKSVANINMICMRARQRLLQILGGGNRE